MMVISKSYKTFSTACLIFLTIFYSDLKAQEIHLSPFEPFGKHQEQFKNAWNKVQDFSYEKDQRSFKNYTIYLVSGISTKIYPPMVSILRSLGIFSPAGTADSFYQQKAYLKKLGIPFKEIDIATNGDPEENGDTIAKAILSSPRDALVVSHSKGGLDVLYSLLRHPELKKKVKGWVSLQTPFFGTPLSETGKSFWPLSAFSRLFLFAVTNGTDSVGSMNQPFRQAFYERNQDLIDKVLKEVPTIGLGTWFLYRPSSEKSLFELPKTKKSVLHPFIAKIYETDGPNDGLVPLKSTCLPNMKCYFVGGLDHANPVMMPGPFNDMGKDKRIHLTRVFLHLMLQEIQTFSK
ncbi:hypothetical protein OAK75_05285 [Bacteriovoracales bacterium]|nr:hypothetical protein [Bacteriovoracales bacterium]